MPKFKSKVVVIEAMQFLDTSESIMAISRFLPDPLHVDYADSGRPVINIHTLEGTMTAHPGDWIIRGTEGEFYPCKDSVFQRKYEEA